MTDTPLDPASILWIRGEIETSSEEAMCALEAYFEHQDADFLVSAKKALHQIYGTLQIVELYPPSTLTQELEKTLDYILEEKIDLSSESISQIIQCISLISRCIDGVLENKQPINANQLMTPLNILRAIRQEPVLEPLVQHNQFFEHQGLAASTESSKQNVYVLAKKLLKLYQFSYLKFVEEVSQDQNLVYMSQSVQRFSRLFPQKNLVPLWSAISNTLESVIIQSQYNNTTHLNEFLGKTSHLLKVFASAQTNEVNSKILTSLFLEALAILEALDQKTKAASIFLESYKKKLSQAPAADELPGNINKSTLLALSDALMEELSYVKDALDVYSRTKESPTEDLQVLLKKLQQLSDSLILVQDLEIPRQALDEQILILDKILTTSVTPHKDWLVELATSLLFLESSIVGIKNRTSKKPTREQSAEDIVIDARKTLMREMLAELSTIKSLFVDCVSATWDHARLKQMCTLFSDIELRLLYIDEPQAMMLLEQINLYMTHDLLHRSAAPEWKEVEEFADIIAALDQYLYLRIDTSNHPSKLLDDSLNRLEKLFHLTDEQKASQVEEHLKDNVLQNIQPPLEADAAPAPAPQNTDIKTQADDEDSENDEIREIFREELDEIIEEIQIHLNTINQNPEDSQCFSHIRRLVHTIKGSGRMAQIDAVSEPAWALESRLNNMIDKNEVPTIRFLHSISDFMNQAKILASDTSQATLDISNQFLETFSNGVAPASPESMEDLLETEVELKPETTSDNAGSLFSDMERQEIGSHLDILHHYIHANSSYIEQAPQDEKLLRATHTLKAIFNSTNDTALKDAFTDYEATQRVLMSRNHHRNSLFFEALQKCHTLISNIKDQADHEASTLDLKTINLKLMEFCEAQVPVPTPYADWLEQNYDIFDIFIKNQGITDDQSLHASNADTIQSAIDAAADQDLKQLEVILTYYKLFVSNLYSLASEEKIAFLPDGQKMQDLLLNIADTIAIGHANPDLKNILTSFSELSTPLEEYIQAQSLLENTTTSSDLSESVDESPQNYVPSDVPSETPTPETNDEDDSSEIMSIFQEELGDILNSIDSQLALFRTEQGSLNHLQELQRDYHTIKGGANYINEHFLFELAKEADLICERFLDTRKVVSPDVVATLLLTQNIFRDRLEKLPTITPLSSVEVQILEDLRATKPPLAVLSILEDQEDEISEHAVEQQPTSTPQDPVEAESQADVSNTHIEALAAVELGSTPNDPIDLLPIETAITLSENKDPEVTEDNSEIIEIFLEEIKELLEALDVVTSELNPDAQGTSQSDLPDKTLRILHTLKGGARLAGILELGNVTHQVEQEVEDIKAEQFVAYKPKLENFTHAVRLHIEELHQRFQSHHNNEEEKAAERSPELVLPNSESSSTSEFIASESTLTEPEDTTVTNPNALSPQASNQTEDEEKLDDYDQEILEIFYEESKELVEELEKTVSMIEEQSITEKTMDQLKRTLHTIKGSARLAGFAAFGNQAHLFESHLETLSTPTQPEETAKVIELNDDLFVGLQKILKAIESHLEGANNEQTPHQPSPKPTDISTAAPAAKRRQKVAKRKKNTEVVRIGADLLEKLVNLAGETVISRSSVQQELLGFNRIIDDFGLTLDRIRDQIRNFETETENRMLSQNNSFAIPENVITSEQYQEFDTLEMDRFSSFHQLARSLSESASDLIDMRDSMIDKVRTTEALIIQQSRVQTQLHEGLMQSRMVPFSRLAPRLTRMVRQIADELGKKAELEIINAEGEMDRSVLERMIPPLEHMLRNSLDHGIEDPPVRAEKNKPVVGKITLHLFREGNEIVLRLSDDGAGIDVERVKEKAIAQGMLSPQANLTEKEILQFIFKPGFSTATQVTQISGRGVGMDVVFSEIKQLNGSLKIHAAQGVGTQFTIRLPFTVSMSRALMVKVGEESYAIPLTHIEGVVRVSPYELAAIYESDSKTFSYADKQYEVQYLGNYLQTKARDSDIRDSVPLLLARNTERSVAVQVDNLIGSREIVVKNPGQQLSQVVGLSGATILGDGSVVIILDLNSLIRDDIAHQQQEHEINEDFHLAHDQSSQSTPLVMVVDDSVTVRKVTSRLLERHGMDVVTAKDGIDAVTQLRDTTPSLILLDIEMPRMDGFEVASHIRHDPRLAGIPIIMISSRTGEKHRSRAQALDVNYFLGKPYQELQLIEKINELVHIP